jgi:hypothetical protein
MTSSSASDHGNPAGISALMQKGTTSKGIEVNKNFAKWLSCGIQISGTFGLHHVFADTLHIWRPSLPSSTSESAVILSTTVFILTVLQNVI